MQKSKLKIFFSAKKARGLYFSSSQAKASGQFVPEQIFSPLWPIINPTSTLLIIAYLPKEYITLWAKNGKKNSTISTNWLINPILFLLKHFIFQQLHYYYA